MAQLPAHAALQIAQAHLSAGRHSDAETIYRQLLIQSPSNTELLYILGLLAGRAGRLGEAISLLDRAASLSPTNADYWIQLGTHQRKAGSLPAAIASLQRAVNLKPDDAQLHYILANALQSAGEFEQSIISYRKAIAIRPDYAEALGNLGSACKEIGRLDEAIACYRNAIELKPDGVIDHDNLMMALLYHPASTKQTLLQECVHWNAQHAVPLRQWIQSHTHSTDPDRPLRIGYVSPDFYDHPVGRFMLPLLTSHDRGSYQVFCYSNVQKPDDFTTRLAVTGHAWRDISPLSDSNVADLIRADQIDILVNLALHTGKNRLLVFARKPAPVQAVYLGYAGGCGLELIDYRLTDQFLDPADSQESDYLQRSIKLTGSYWCYQPPAIELPVESLPAIGNGYLTFGCLNNFSKLTDATLLTWAELLRSFCDARLLLHVPQGDARKRVCRLMLESGVAENRLAFVGRVHATDYLKSYNQIDIELDPFPFAGGTTTCDAMWMGVPVVTLAGDTPVGRSGVSILSNAGLANLIAHTKEEYVKIASDLAADLPALAAMRADMRRRLLASPLMNGAAFTRSIEVAYRTMWRTWCDSR